MRARVDDKLGDLLAAAVAANGGNPIVLNPGASFAFDFNPAGDLVLDAGQGYTNTVTVVGEDDEGTDATDDDSHTITGTDVAPMITIEKSGPATIGEGGADVTYHFVITAAASNASTDPVTVTSLVDDKLGDLLAAAEAANGGNPIVLDPSDSFTFYFTVENAEFPEKPAALINTVSVSGEDDEETPEKRKYMPYKITASNGSVTLTSKLNPYVEVMQIFGFKQGCSYFKVVTKRDQDFINLVLKEIKVDKQYKAVLTKSISAGNDVNQITITKN